MATVRLVAGLVALTAAVAAPTDARACGGGVVTGQVSTVHGDVQRIFIAARATTTDVVTQVAVPATTADYGVLIPVPGTPTLDPTPVSTSELDDLDSSTAPVIHESHGGGGRSWGCASDSNAGGGGEYRGVSVGDPVDIGPVTAVVVTADSGAALAPWLADNGFVIPAEHQTLVDSYTGSNRSFIALRRNDTATTGVASSVGIHFTLSGDVRDIPLRFARLGAAEEVAFTVFLVSAVAAGPSLPFHALTLDDLDTTVIRDDGYASAVTVAVAAQDGQAFVVERAVATAEFSIAPGTLRDLIDPDTFLVRASTIIAADALTADVKFDTPPPANVTTELFVDNSRERTALPWLLATVAAAGATRRRRRN